MTQLDILLNHHAQEAFDLRESIHREPELAFEEVLTSAKVRAFLDRHDIAYTYPIAKTGLLAEVKGANRERPSCSGLIWMPCP